MRLRTNSLIYHEHMSISISKARVVSEAGSTLCHLLSRQSQAVPAATSWWKTSDGQSQERADREAQQPIAKLGQIMTEKRRVPRSPDSQTVPKSMHCS